MERWEVEQIAEQVVSNRIRDERRQLADSIREMDR